MPNRLGDVFALIQVLGLSPKFAYRSVDRLTASIGEPKSEGQNGWTTIASEHPEFFRITKTGMIILLARFSAEPESESPKELSFEETKILLDAALELHKNQLTDESNGLQRRSINRVFGAAFGTIILSILGFVNSYYKDESESNLILRLKAIEEKVDKIGAARHEFINRQDSIKCLVLK